MKIKGARHCHKKLYQVFLVMRMVFGEMKRGTSATVALPQALKIYKQMSIPLFDYADFMVESASKVKIAKLEKRRL